MPCSLNDYAKHWSWWKLRVWGCGGFVCLFFYIKCSVILGGMSKSGVKLLNTIQIWLLDPNTDLNCWFDEKRVVSFFFVLPLFKPSTPLLLVQEFYKFKVLKLYHIMCCHAEIMFGFFGVCFFFVCMFLKKNPILKIPTQNASNLPWVEPGSHTRVKLFFLVLIRSNSHNET